MGFGSSPPPPYVPPPPPNPVTRASDQVQDAGARAAQAAAAAAGAGFGGTLQTGPQGAPPPQTAGKALFGS